LLEKPKMSQFIVFAGKGGTGKSTLSALTVRYLKERKLSPILVVDADPNFCLPELLGINIAGTLASVRERAIQDKPNNMSLDEWLEIEINRIIEESGGFALLVMGRPEGSGCYCTVNNVLKRILQEISEKYRYIIVDNEAGMEHISRGIISKIDHLFIIATQAKSSIQSALRINQLVDELNLSSKKKALVINQSSGKIEGHDELLKIFGKVVYINFDDKVKSLSEQGGSIFSLNSSAVVIKDFYEFLEEEIER